jgi:hypothetical protein
VTTVKNSSPAQYHSNFMLELGFPANRAPRF